MNSKTFLTVLFLTVVMHLSAQDMSEHYIDVTGTAEIEIVPDKIHYIIDIKEYYEEEFDGKSKPEKYHTKVSIEKIEGKMRETLKKAGIAKNNIRVQEIGDYWRERGQDFLISKRLDITLDTFEQIGDILKNADMRGVRIMRIGELENKDFQEYHKQGKIKALEAAKQKAAYLVGALGKKLGGVIRITEPQDLSGSYGMNRAQSNVISSDAGSFEEFRTIRKSYSMQVRFKIEDM